MAGACSAAPPSVFDSLRLPDLLGPGQTAPLSRSALSRSVAMPWLAAAVVLLLFFTEKDGGRPFPWNLLGSGLICFSIGCLARTSLAIGAGPKP